MVLIIEIGKYSAKYRKTASLRTHEKRRPQFSGAVSMNKIQIRYGIRIGQVRGIDRRRKKRLIQIGRRRAQKRTPRVCSRRLRGIESGAKLLNVCR